jgi:WD40 repeat protein
MRGVDLMSTLFGADLNQLRENFLRNDGVDSNEFVRLLLRHCPELRGATQKRALQGSKATLTRVPLRQRADMAEGQETTPASLDGTMSSVTLGHDADADMLGALTDEGRDAVLQLFHSIDCDGDGVVTWEELYNFAISTTMQRLQPRPSERIRPYAVCHHQSRDDNLQLVEFLPMLDVIAVSSRHRPLQLVDADRFRPLASARISDFALDATVTAVAHAPGPDVVLAFATDLTLHSWAVIDRKLQPLPVYTSDEFLSCMQVPSFHPSTLYAGTSAGSLRLFDISRHFEPAARMTIPIHARGSEDSLFSFQQKGFKDIVTCFTFATPSDHKVISAGFDQMLCITDINLAAATFLNEGDNLKPGDRAHPFALPVGVTCIGQSHSVVSHVAFSESFQVILAAGMDNSLCAWAPQASHAPKTPFEDVLLPHRGRIMGLHCIPGTPQVVSTDVTGMVKVWDLRTFTCAQTMTIDKAHALLDDPNDVEQNGVSRPGDLLSDSARPRRRVCATTFDSLNHKLIVADTDGLTALEYDPGADPSVADGHIVLAVLCNPFADTFVTMSSDAIGIWDADQGVLRSHHPISTGSTDLTVCCFDDRCRRLMLGTSSGTVRVHAYHGLGFLRQASIHTREVTGIYFSAVNNAIISTSLDGVVGMWHEKDPGAPVSKIRLNVGPLTCLACEPALAALAVGTESGRVMLLDVTHPRVVLAEYVPAVQSPARCVTFLGRFPLVAVGFADSSVHLVTARAATDGKLILSFRTEVVGRSTAASTPQTTNYPNGPPSDCPSANGFLDVVSEPAAVEDTDLTAGMEPVGPSSMKFDDVKHILWIADSHGNVSAWTMCPTLQSLAAEPGRYPKPGSICDEMALSSVVSPRQLFHCRLHREEVVWLEIMRDHGCIATSGDDRRVCFLDFDGHRLGELCSGRKSSDGALLDGGSKLRTTSPTSSNLSPSRGRRIAPRRAQPKEQPELEHYDVRRVHRPPQVDEAACAHPLATARLVRGSSSFEAGVSGTSPQLTQHHAGTPTTLEASVPLSASEGEGNVPVLRESQEAEPPLIRRASRPTDTPHSMRNRDPRKGTFAGSINEAHLPSAFPPTKPARLPHSSASASTPSSAIGAHRLRGEVPTGWRMAGRMCVPLDDASCVKTIEHLDTLLGTGSKAAAQQRLQTSQRRRVSAQLHERIQSSGASDANLRSESILNSPREQKRERDARERLKPPKNECSQAVVESISMKLVALHDSAMLSPRRASAAPSSPVAKPATRDWEGGDRVPQTTRPPRPPVHRLLLSEAPSPLESSPVPLSASGRLAQRSAFSVASVSAPGATVASAPSQPRLTSLLNLVGSAVQRTTEPNTALQGLEAMSPQRPWTSDHGAPNPRRGLVTGSAKLGRDFSVQPAIKADKRELRLRAFKTELQECLLGSRRARHESLFDL